MNALGKAAALSALLLVGIVPLSGCGGKDEAGAPAASGPTGSAGTGAPAGNQTAAKASEATVTEGKQDLKEAVCVICAVEKRDSDTPKPEPVKASIEYQGKGYYFCNESEKAEFISNPKKYAVSSQ